MALAVALLAGCSDGEECEAGAWVLTEVGASLVLASVSADGEPVPSVELSRLRFDGRPADVRGLVAEPLAEGLSLDGELLTCTLPCTLAGSVGRWQARVTGPPGTTARVDARSAPLVDPGGCLPVTGDIPEIALRLEPPVRPRG